jgi:hypothetical protein
MFHGYLKEKLLVMPEIAYRLDLSADPGVPDGYRPVLVMPHPYGLRLDWGSGSTVVRPEIPYSPEAYFAAMALLHLKGLGQEQHVRLDPRVFHHGAGWPEIWLCYLDLCDLEEPPQGRDQP